jgi:hypothetical protein
VEAAVRRDQVKKSGAKMLGLLVDGSAAESRATQASYLLALCLHEQAERLQARADRLARATPAADPAELKAAQEAARGAWKDTAGWWNSYTQEHPVSPFSVPARLWQARAREALGNRERALSLLEDSSGENSAFQKAARFYLARRLKGS